MAKLSERVREAITTHLQQGEELRAVAQLQTGKLDATTSRLLLGACSLFTDKFWYAGVTSKNLILIILDNFSKPKHENSYSIPLSNVSVKGKNINVVFSAGDSPVLYRLYCGAKFLTGLDGDLFLSLISNKP